MRLNRTLLLIVVALTSWGQQPGPSLPGPTLPGLPEIKIQPGTAAEKPTGESAQEGEDPLGDDVLSVRDGDPLMDTETRFVTGTYRVIAPTTVVDKGGAHVTNLRPDEFVLYDNGKKQDISVDVTFQPISLVVAVQASAATQSVLPEIQNIGPMIQPLITGQDGEIAVVAFDHRVRVMQDFTRDPDAVDKAMQKIKAGSSTSAFVDTVMQASNMLRNRPRGNRRVLLLIAENRDKGSETKTKYALTEVEVHNIEVYTVNINRLRTKLTREMEIPRPDPIPTEARGQIGHMPATPTAQAQMRPAAYAGSSLNFVPIIEEIFRQVKSIFIDNHAEVFTKYTGGREYGYTTRKDLERAISELGEHLHSQYMLSYQPNNREEGGWHEITVQVLRPNLEVFSRRGYWTASFFEGNGEDADLTPSQELKKQQRKDREKREKEEKKKQ